ncbi:MAG: GatB/YqeY domain-containing protein [Candidatus Wildermuthbacteria bacterium]|nr:GatB/YqeY domain-containing protein [Candidatus Wildermuthbacteria bacterium]
MASRQQIQEDLKDALRKGDAVKVGALRMLSSSFIEKQKAKRYKIWKENPSIAEAELQQKSELSEEEIEEVIASETKKRRESIEAFEKGGRQDLVVKEKRELEVLQGYLPQQLSEEELRALVKEAIAKTGAAGPKDMGKVMAELMPKVKGKSDGAIVSRIVKESLT